MTRVGADRRCPPSIIDEYPATSDVWHGDDVGPDDDDDDDDDDDELFVSMTSDPRAANRYGPLGTLVGLFSRRYDTPRTLKWEWGGSDQQFVFIVSATGYRRSVAIGWNMEDERCE